MENKWIILMPMGSGPEPAWWGDDNRPVVYDTQKEATVKIVEDFIDRLQNQVQELEDGHREVDDIDTECDEWVEPCTLHEDGCITLETDDNFYDPKTWVR